jgi:hypothetical protein
MTLLPEAVPLHGDEHATHHAPGYGSDSELHNDPENA